MELLGHDPRTSYCSVHGAIPHSGLHLARTKDYRQPRSLARRFHVYAARWRPHRITFYVDGRRCGSIGTLRMLPIQRQQVLVGMAVGGSWPGPPGPSTPTPAHMLVDWVRVYAR
jgi:beta-glucanase (GH16 family)